MANKIISQEELISKLKATLADLEYKQYTITSNLNLQIKDIQAECADKNAGIYLLEELNT